ncbi:hypothetical protein HMPREF9134_01457 [Porphyromonas catoniae F0037]|uniref:Uncharacterized protein n=1 Tax=Porphyromonas catoniae F0037 TaxID=1127696 RepID=L1NBG7_9PORP|nr:hypothetical protein HMPREF9134_01457 [Porphyromonas catoniae F0037]
MSCAEGTAHSVLLPTFRFPLLDGLVALASLVAFVLFSSNRH